MNTRNEPIETILQVCLERLARGEPLEAVLASYPEQAASLRPALEAAAWLTARRPALAPRPDFLAATQPELIARLRLSRRRRFGWAYAPLQPAVRIFLALLLVGALLLNGASIAYAAPTWLPGDPLYGIRTAGESANLLVTPGPAGDARLHTEYALRRLLEAQSLTLEGQPEYLPLTVDDYIFHVQQAEADIRLAAARYPAQGQALAVDLRRALVGQVDLLHILVNTTSGAGQAELLRMVAVTHGQIAAMDEIIAISGRGSRPAGPQARLTGLTELQGAGPSLAVTTRRLDRFQRCEQSF